LAEALGLIGASNGPRIPVELRPTVEQAGQATLELGAAVRRFFEGLARVMDDPDLVGAGSDETQLRVTAAIRAGSRWQELAHVWAEAMEHQQVVERAVIELTG